MNDEEERAWRYRPHGEPEPFTLRQATLWALALVGLGLLILAMVWR